ncbi:MAG: methyltransferase domain-containing protein [Dehalococcoidales bacterium]|nr:methyltransferase domain-containing protein [Dehalococcoidales bacterium]
MAAAIMQKMPGVSAIMIDYADEMVRLAKERFQDKPEVAYFKYDLNHGLPEEVFEGVYDLVVSGFALHHVDFPNRLPLYRQILQVLKPGGVFLNGDRFAEESTEVNGWMFNNWVSWMTDRATERFGASRTFDQIRMRQLEMDKEFGDKPGSLWEMERELRAAGFKSIDCLYKNQVCALVCGVK